MCVSVREGDCWEFYGGNKLFYPSFTHPVGAYSSKPNELCPPSSCQHNKMRPPLCCLGLSRQMRGRISTTASSGNFDLLLFPHYIQIPAACLCFRPKWVGVPRDNLQVHPTFYKKTNHTCNTKWSCARISGWCSWPRPLSLLECKSNINQTFPPWKDLSPFNSWSAACDGNQRGGVDLDNAIIVRSLGIFCSWHGGYGPEAALEQARKLGPYTRYRHSH